MEESGADQGSSSMWSESKAQGGDGADLASLPDGVQAIVEECRAQAKQTSGADATAVKGAPYPCRMYEEAGPGEEDMLQLQWMRIDMSTMDSERCWGESCHHEEYDCGPDSGLVLPAVYTLDPAQLLPCTLIGLPPELQRARQDSSDAFGQRAPEEMTEDYLFKLGESLTEALSNEPGSQEGVPPEVVEEIAMLSGADWSVCLEHYVDLPRCEPVLLAQVLSTAAPPTLDCLVGTVLPAVVTRITRLSFRNSAGAEPTSREAATNNESSSSSRNSGAREEAGLEEGTGTVTSAPRNSNSTSRDTAAVHTICRLAASVAASSTTPGTRVGEENGGPDPAQFRDKISGSELRKLGPLGREAEVALAEAFFYREGEAAIL
eukprot:g12907.t1